MYQSYPSLIIGFHGCDQEKGYDLLNKRLLFSPSNNLYDWLGEGMYFWENNESRAHDWAVEGIRRRGVVAEPFVIGAVIDLGHCFNLLDHENLKILREQYKRLVKKFDEEGRTVPKNDRKLHFLDRAVIEATHEYVKENKSIQDLKEFDSVRAAFAEGDHIYPDASFLDKDHIQICIRNPNCIKGFFLPRDNNNIFSRV